MRLLRFASDLGPRLGALLDGGENVVDLSDAFAGKSLNDLLGEGEEGLDRLRRAADAARASARPAASLTLLAPVDAPTILCAGENYGGHLDEKPRMPFSWGGPAHFFKLPQTLAGANQPVAHPGEDITCKLDYEAELAVVIGRGGRRIDPAAAMDHVAGYTIINDMALRDWQVRLLGEHSVSLLGMSKNFDGATPLGPHLVTPDEVPDPHALAVRCTVNGIVRQQDNTENFVRPIPELIAFFSRFLTLVPGTIIATGACGGTAWGFDAELGGTLVKPAGVNDPYLWPGDRVACEVEGIGVLTTEIVA
jgi:2-keto-4-pentenoate hydratase/2-oxohepta-3-ene-1,7-dioic acid hydratase in catechol pathway